MPNLQTDTARLAAELRRLSAVTDGDDDEYADYLDTIEWELAEAPATCAADVLVKLNRAAWLLENGAETCPEIPTLVRTSAAYVKRLN